MKFNKYITILKTTVDLCEQVKSADKECPLEQGPIKVVKNFTLPEEIPKVSLIEGGMSVSRKARGGWLML